MSTRKNAILHARLCREEMLVAERTKDVETLKVFKTVLRRSFMYRDKCQRYGVVRNRATYVFSATVHILFLME